MGEVLRWLVRLESDDSFEEQPVRFQLPLHGPHSDRVIRLAAHGGRCRDVQIYREVGLR